MLQTNTRSARGTGRDAFILGALCLVLLFLLFLSEPLTGRFLPEGSFSLNKDEVLTLLLTASVAGYLFLVRRRHPSPARQPRDLSQILERLRHAEARHRGLVESIPAVIYIAAPGHPWTTTYMSPQVEDLLGFTPDEMTGGEQSKWLEQTHPDDRDRVVAESAHHMQTGEPLLSTYRMFARSGDTVWVSRRAAIVRDERGRPMFSQGVVFDVTYLKEMELPT